MKIWHFKNRKNLQGQNKFSSKFDIILSKTLNSGTTACGIYLFVLVAVFSVFEIPLRFSNFMPFSQKKHTALIDLISFDKDKCLII